MTEQREGKGLPDEEKLETFQKIVDDLKHLETGSSHLDEIDASGVSLEVLPYFQELDQLFKDLELKSVSEWFLDTSDDLQHRINELDKASFDGFFEKVQKLAENYRDKQYLKNSPDGFFVAALNNKLQPLLIYSQVRQRNLKKQNE